MPHPHNPRKGPTDIDEGTDAWDTIDWLVKRVPDNNGPIDVYPENYPNPDPNPAGVKMGGDQQLVRCDAMRGKFRPPHMVQVQSSWFPLVDRNPQRSLDTSGSTARARSPLGCGYWCAERFATL